MNQKIVHPYVIFEVANVHAGDPEALFEVVNEYGKIDYSNKGIKFQPLKPDEIALPDFAWFSVYEELYFDPATWSQVIELSARSGDVWLDLFDSYGAEILQANIQHVSGIKLQASVLDNLTLLDAISQLDLTGIRLMINVSGFDLSSIEDYIEQFRALDVSDIVLQLGFQSYPTEIADTGLQKIAVLKAAFPEFELCIADHSPADEEVSQQIPVWALAAGCDIVEKHFCVERSKAKYDFYSSLEPHEFRSMLDNITNLKAAYSGAFISTSEEKYLNNSHQVPIARHEIPKGGLVALSDLSFRRTNQKGYTLPELRAQQQGFNILENSISLNSTISAIDFRRARVGTIIACRMKSSRLKQKATLKLNGKASVERCLQNCLLMEDVDDVILATSNLADDQVLENYTLDGLVRFWQGDAEDVIKRYLGACEKYDIDVIVRMTSDCPVVSPEIASYLLKKHFEAGADYTAAKHSAVGTSPEIYNTTALQRVIDLLGSAEYSEYMTWYLQNNPDYFKINTVNLPQSLRRDYRLTLDYQEDLEMFDELFRRLDEKGLPATTANVFAILDDDPELAGINQDLALTYKTDQDLIDRLNQATKISAD